MTATQSVSRKSAMKTSKPNVIKRRSSVSFGGSVKFESPLKQQADKLLQATDKKRRYMRRGSKSPNMLSLSIKVDFIEMDSSDLVRQTMSPTKRRRLSLMSALKLSLEQTEIAPKEVKTSSLPSFERLSQL